MRSRVTVSIALCFAVSSIPLFAPRSSLATFLPPRAGMQKEARTSTAPIPTWTGRFDYLDKTYSYTMIGTDPALGSQKTKIHAYLIPVELHFADGTVESPTNPMADGTGKSAIYRVFHSPLFKPAPILCRRRFQVREDPIHRRLPTSELLERRQ